jgi:hypothetical protein
MFILYTTHRVNKSTFISSGDSIISVHIFNKSLFIHINIVFYPLYSIKKQEKKEAAVWLLLINFNKSVCNPLFIDRERTCHRRCADFCRRINLISRSKSASNRGKSKAPSRQSIKNNHSCHLCISVTFHSTPLSFYANLSLSLRICECADILTSRLINVFVVYNTKKKKDSSCSSIMQKMTRPESRTRTAIC